MNNWVAFLYSNTQRKYVLIFYGQFIVYKVKVSEHFLHIVKNKSKAVCYWNYGSKSAGGSRADPSPKQQKFYCLYETLLLQMVGAVLLLSLKLMQWSSKNLPHLKSEKVIMVWHHVTEEYET